MIERAAKFAVPLALAGVVAVAAAAPAFAESSSWFTREKETPVPKLAPSPKKPPQSTAPATLVPEPGGASDMRNKIPTEVPATGDDAAYTAFDQGQYLTALKLAEEAAARGEPQANTLIARIYTEGLGVQKDDRKAFEYYKRASDLGDIQGTFALAISYAQGRGVKKDRKAAAELFEKAALTGQPDANYNLGLLFLKGDGKPENPIRAFQHIRYAAEKGLAQAQYDLAALYQNGTGTDANALEAARWLSRAAEQGYPEAQYEYAIRLIQGMGLTKDEPKIPALMKAAAGKGIAGAQNRLAYIYFDGIKVKKDPVEAAKWRLIAKKNGYEDEELDARIAAMPKADRQKAEAAASAWSDRIRVDAGLADAP
ncbi:tetratricopeptide repeat protein [Hyphomicrobium sp.]|uniref:tetratricopeptide repeat protein n=1 Tax=Hyphomicrobium sp. TaxID=82 RepID=UPI002D7945A6|nr:tetratricopeptide repeat protein [Hyphomicrobium sp.]HET6390075.1 tetratricopeptide repeat protein [Hyphomicrobium sp.]